MRVVAWAVVVAAAAVLATWAYDIGRRSTGTDPDWADRSIQELRDANAALMTEIARLRSLQGGSESSLQIEQAAQKLLAERNTALIEENARLKEELAVFERLARLEGGSSGSKEVAIERLSVWKEGAGRYRYNFLVALQGARRGKETKLDLRITVLQRNGAPLVFPQGGAASPAHEIVLRNFRRIEGKFEVPAPAIIDAVEIGIYEAGRLKASQRVTIEESENVRKSQQ